jgi:hypothetical protein
MAQEKLETLTDLMRWTRDYASNARHREHLLSNSFVWHQLCAAFDAVEDTDLAIDAYLEGSFLTEIPESNTCACMECFRRSWFNRTYYET